MKNILFDFDGTIADTSEGIVSSMHYAYDMMGIKRCNDNTIREIIGPPLEEMLRYLLPQADDRCIQQAITLFRENYSKRGVLGTRLYPQVKETLNILKESGKRLYIVTSKPEPFVKQIGERYEILSYFADISALLLNAKNLSKAARMRQLIEKYEMDVADTVVVGDRPEDANAAKENGLPCIGMTYGYGSEASLTESGCKVLVDNFSMLCNVVDKLSRK